MAGTRIHVSQYREVDTVRLNGLLFEGADDLIITTRQSQLNVSGQERRALQFKAIGLSLFVREYGELHETEILVRVSLGYIGKICIIRNGRPPL